MKKTSVKAIEIRDEGRTVELREKQGHLKPYRFTILKKAIIETVGWTEAEMYDEMDRWKRKEIISSIIF